MNLNSVWAGRSAKAIAFAAVATLFEFSLLERLFTYLSTGAVV